MPLIKPKCLAESFPSHAPLHLPHPPGRSLKYSLLITTEALGGIPENGLCENSEFVNPEMRETLSYPFQKER